MQYSGIKMCYQKIYTWPFPPHSTKAPLFFFYHKPNLFVLDLYVNRITQHVLFLEVPCLRDLAMLFGVLAVHFSFIAE